MSGACAGCQMASATLDGVQQRIVEELGEFVRVIPAEGPSAQGRGPGGNRLAQVTSVTHEPAHGRLSRSRWRSALAAPT